MTLRVEIFHDNVGYILDIVKELRDKGYVQGSDFDFAFIPVEIDNSNYQIIKEKHTVFMFYKEELATWFTLVWQ